MIARKRRRSWRNLREWDALTPEWVEILRNVRNVSLIIAVVGLAFILGYLTGLMVVTR